jgi:undecaprenyl-diphosphatase
MMPDQLDYLSAVQLGALQGATEFLPVSSSGHLALLQYVMGLQDVPHFFDLCLHLGTLFAVFWHFRRLLVNFFRERPSPGVRPPADIAFRITHGRRGLEGLMRLSLLLAITTAPVVFAVLLFPSTKPGQPATWRSRIGDIRAKAKEHPEVVLCFLAITSVVLIRASQANAGTIDPYTTTLRHALLIGIAQTLSAFCPGLSRSGMTISTALLLGFRGDWAVNFSLLASIPAVLGATLKELRDIDWNWLTPQNTYATLAGTFTAAVIGWLCIQLLNRAVTRNQWGWFGVYLWFVVLGGFAAQWNGR